jgi:pimeloyl-ACP methyl ester carboxylesterase
VEQRRADVDGLEVFWNEAPGPGTPVLYVHGVPTDGDDWIPFLERTGGIAPDLPGFGRSAKPAHFDYSIGGYDRFLEAFLAQLGVEKFSLVVHDWGAAALALAQRFPERVERVVVINSVPLLPGYRWHPIARWWRRPLAGELVMGFTFKRALQRTTRLPDEVAERIWSRFDHGTQRAILKLYRSAPPAVLAAAGERLGAIGAPALVVWGERDQFIPTRFADAYAAALDGEALMLPDAGHWPWLDRPDVVEKVAAHVAG